MVKRIEKLRSSCSEVFCKKGLVKNFAKFTPLESLTGLRCFHVNFPKFLRIPIL